MALGGRRGATRSVPWVVGSPEVPGVPGVPGISWVLGVPGVPGAPGAVVFLEADLGLRGGWPGSAKGLSGMI